MLSPEIMTPCNPRRFTMYRHKVQDVGTEAQNHETEFLGVEGEKDSVGKLCLHCMAGTLFWGLMVALTYLLTFTGIVYAIP